MLDSTPSPTASSLSPTSAPTIIPTETPISENPTIYPTYDTYISHPFFLNISFDVFVSMDNNGTTISVRDISTLVNDSTNEYLKTIQFPPYFLFIDVSESHIDDQTLFNTDMQIKLESDDIPTINNDDLFELIATNGEAEYGKDILQITQMFMSTTSTSKNATELTIISNIESDTPTSDIILTVILIVICLVLICMLVFITIWYFMHCNSRDNNDNDEENEAVSKEKILSSISEEIDSKRKDTLDPSFGQKIDMLPPMIPNPIQMIPDLADTADAIFAQQYGGRYGEKTPIQTIQGSSSTIYGEQQEGIVKDIGIMNVTSVFHIDDHNPSCSDAEELYKNTMLTQGMSDRQKYTFDNSDSCDIPENETVLQYRNTTTTASSAHYGDV